MILITIKSIVSLQLSIMHLVVSTRNLVTFIPAFTFCEHFLGRRRRIMSPAPLRVVYILTFCTLAMFSALYSILKTLTVLLQAPWFPAITSSFLAFFLLIVPFFLAIESIRILLQNLFNRLRPYLQILRIIATITAIALFRAQFPHRKAIAIQFQTLSLLTIAKSRLFRLLNIRIQTIISHLLLLLLTFLPIFPWILLICVLVFSQFL